VFDKIISLLINIRKVLQDQRIRVKSLFAELSSKVIILKNNAPSIITGKGNISMLCLLNKPKLYYLKLS